MIYYHLRNNELEVFTRDEGIGDTYAIESGKSLTKVSKKLGININTVCCLINEYNREHRITDNSGKTATSGKTQTEIKELGKE